MKKIILKNIIFNKIIFLLLLSSLFFFLPEVLFADYNQGQGKLISVLVKDDSICAIAPEEIKFYIESEGVCYGLSSVWLYSKWRQFSAPQETIKNSNDWFKDAIIDIISSSWLHCDDVNKFVSLVKKFQTSQTIPFEKMMEELINTEGGKLHKEYSIASLFTLDQLKHILKQNIIRNHKLILIKSHNHATALFRDSNNYYYFDPNANAGEVVVDTTDKVAELIFDANNFFYTKPSQLTFLIFSFTEDYEESYPELFAAQPSK